MELRFRTAGEQDLPEIVSTYNQAIASRIVTADLEPVTAESRQAWFRSHGGRRPLWIVESGGRYAGWISVRSFYGRPAYDGVAEVSIYIDSAWQGKGIGKRCLSYVIGQAPALGLHTLLGFIFASNQRSVALFERQGFRRWGHLPAVADMDGVMLDLLILGRKIESAHENPHSKT